MEDVQIKLDDNNEGQFYIEEGKKKVAEMEVSASTTSLTVYHTEVSPEKEGKGLAKKLLDAAVDYARKNNLKVIALCPFVSAQFKRHPDQYADVLSKAVDKKV